MRVRAVVSCRDRGADGSCDTRQQRQRNHTLERRQRTGYVGYASRRLRCHVKQCGLTKSVRLCHSSGMELEISKANVVLEGAYEVGSHNIALSGFTEGIISSLVVA